jgi:hypothetical protein
VLTFALANWLIFIFVVESAAIRETNPNQLNLTLIR